MKLLVICPKASDGRSWVSWSLGDRGEQSWKKGLGLQISDLVHPRLEDPSWAWECHGLQKSGGAEKGISFHTSGGF